MQGCWPAAGGFFFLQGGYCFKKNVEYRGITASAASKKIFAPFVLKNKKLSNENMVHPPYLRWSETFPYFLAPSFCRVGFTGWVYRVGFTGMLARRRRDFFFTGWVLQGCWSNKKRNSQGGHIISKAAPVYIYRPGGVIKKKTVMVCARLVTPRSPQGHPKVTCK